MKMLFNEEVAFMKKCDWVFTNVVFPVILVAMLFVTVVAINYH